MLKTPIALLAGSVIACSRPGPLMSRSFVTFVHLAIGLISIVMTPSMNVT